MPPTSYEPLLTHDSTSPARAASSPAGSASSGPTSCTACAEPGASVVVVDSLVPEHGGDRDPTLDGARRRGRRRRHRRRPRSPTPSPAPTSCSTSPARSATWRRCSEPLRDLDLNVRSHLAFLETLRRVAPDGRGRADVDPPGVRPAALPARRRGAPDRAGRRQRRRQAGLRAAPPALRPTTTTCASTVLRLTNVYGPRQHLEREGLGFLPGVRPPGARSARRSCSTATARSAATACTSTTSSTPCCCRRTTPDAVGRGVQPRPRGLADAGRDRRADPAGGRRRRRRALRAVARTSCCASTSAASTATSPRPSGSSAGRRASSFADGIDATVRYYVDRSWSPSST